MYNSEKTIERCLQSIVDQTFKNLEIVLVNDGSIDKSLEICKNWENKDDRIIVVSQDNRGVSSARNNGIKHSSGELLTFVDSDDYLKREAYSVAIKPFENEKIDQVVFNMYYVNTIKEIEVSHSFGNNTIEGDEIFDYIIRPMINPHYAKNASLLQSPCNKIYRRRIINKWQISFDESLSWAEDFLFNVEYYRFIDSVCFIENHLYYYDNRTSGSLSKKSISYEGFDNSMKIRRYLSKYFPNEYGGGANRTELLMNILKSYYLKYINYNGIRGFYKYARLLSNHKDVMNVCNKDEKVPVQCFIPSWLIKNRYWLLYRCWLLSIIIIPECKKGLKLIFGSLGLIKS